MTGAYIEGVWNLSYLSSEVKNRLGIKVKTLEMSMNDFTSYAKSVYDYNQSHADKITIMSFSGSVIPFFNQIVMTELGKDSANNMEEAITALRNVYRTIEKNSHL